MIEHLITIYSRDLAKLQKEIESFRDEKDLWVTVGAITNPAGNLCLHLIGNLRTYIGKNIGQQAYVRNREAEFSSRGISRSELIQGVAVTTQIVIATLRNLEEVDLSALHSEDVFGHQMTNSFFLIHLASHLSYHLGQINYLRRALEA